MKSDKSSKAVNVDGRTSVFARHNADMNIPRLPFKGGKSEGGMLSLQRGNAEAKRVRETGERRGVRPWASGGEPTEQRAGRKKIRLSERSELPDFPTCKRREGV